MDPRTCPLRAKSNRSQAAPIGQLVYGQNECAATRSLTAEQTDDVPGLPGMKAVKRLIHQPAGMRRQQSDRQQQL